MVGKHWWDDMIPDDAVERLMDSALEIGKACDSEGAVKSLHHKDATPVGW